MKIIKLSWGNKQVYLPLDMARKFYFELKKYFEEEGKLLDKRKKKR